MRRVLVALTLVTLTATTAMALEARTFPRATAPHIPSIDFVALGLPAAHVRWTGGQVIVEAASWTGVNLTAVQAAIDAAPADTRAERSKAAVDGTQGLAACLVEAMARALVPTLNQTRTDPLTIKAAITAAQVRTALKTQIDTLGCGN